MLSTDLETNLSAARHEMIEQHCRGRGICDGRVLAALAEVPRERFVADEYVDEAYTDRALPIAYSQTISQPYIVALMTEALELNPHHAVLEIGTGSGYQTAILSRLARAVHTVERIDDLSRRAAARLVDLGIDNVCYHVGDGSAGWPVYAPYDRIIVTAGAPHVPPELVDQLELGGRLVVPVGDENTQTLIVVERHAECTIERPLVSCRFVKLIGHAGWPVA